MLENGFILNKKTIVENDIIQNYLKNSIQSLEAEEFRLYKSNIYSEDIKFSITTIIYDSENDDLFFKNINSVLGQSLENVELILISNGAKISLLNRLKNLLNDHKNITIVINPVPQFEKDIVSLYCPVISLANLGLVLSKGSLFTWLSWDDEINRNYCKSIYENYLKKGYKCLSPMPKAIDLDSRIIKKRTNDLAKTFEGLKDTVDSIDIMKSRIDIFKKDICISPGELLCFERKFLISRQGIDFDIDLSQYFRVSAGESIALVKDAFLFWRYHPNQAHLIHSSYCNKSHIKRIKDLYKITNIYQMHLNLYGEKWAKKIKNYYENRKIVDYISNHIILFIYDNKFYPLKFFKEIKSEINFNQFLLILFEVMLFILKKFLYFLIALILNPNKIFKIKKYIK
tara:strand:- start:166 stop:1365 length:1200 start_codon:yes stop_codon:yes gene_type:complete